MGEKPLYYQAGPNAFVFGCELRALLEHPAVPRELSLSNLHRYLSFEYVPAPHSILAGIDKLPPGHQLTMSPGGKPRVRRLIAKVIQRRISRLEARHQVAPPADHERGGPAGVGVFHALEQLTQGGEVRRAQLRRPGLLYARGCFSGRPLCSSRLFRA